MMFVIRMRRVKEVKLRDVHACAHLPLSYADCSEQLDFNAGINPVPLNFILQDQNVLLLIWFFYVCSFGFFSVIAYWCPWLVYSSLCFTLA